MMQLDPRAVYYALQALTYFVVYSAVFIGSGVSLWQLGSTLSNCALRPTSVPLKLFLTLLNRFGYLSGCLLIPSLLLAAIIPDYFAARFVAAVFATVFHLSDCSRTGAHNGYLMIWNVWSFCLLPVRLSLGLAFGAAVWFILSSGFSKLWIGGIAWCYPDTMQSILASFVYKSPKAGGPVINCLCRLAIKYPYVCGALGTLTIMLEVVYVPFAAVLAPRSWQIVTAYLMVLLHFGIAIMHSSAIGVFFLPNVASYVVGFYDFEADDLFPWTLLARLNLRIGQPSAEAGDWQPFHGYCWFVGVLLIIIALLYTAVKRRLIAEDWPLTPMALFPWNGRQWRLLHSAFVEGNTRMVALPPEIADYINKAHSDGGTLSLLNKLLAGAPVVPIVGAAKIRNDEDSRVVNDNAGTGSLWEYIRHMVFGTSPFARDLRAHTISESKKKAGSDRSLADPLVADNGEQIDCMYLYDIWTRVLGPTTYQEELLASLEQELFAGSDAAYDVDKGLPVLMNSLQGWLRKSERLVEVSSGRTITNCAFVKVDSEDVVKEVLTWPGR